MKFNIDQPLLDLDGKPMGEEDAPFTYKQALFLIVTTVLPEDNKLLLATRMTLFDLAGRVNGGGVIELTAEEVVQIKSRANSVIAQVVTLGRVVQFLEGNAGD